MALIPSAAFAAKNALSAKTPMYLVDFQVDPDLDTHVKYCTYMPLNLTDLTPLPYISSISGGSYAVTPDEGTTSSAKITVTLQDTNNEVTAMIAGATGKLQKKKCLVKAGYVGMDEADMLSIFYGEVTGYDYGKDGTWAIDVSDAIRDLNKYLFRSATTTNELLISGNPITVLLALLMSDQGDGTNGIYDYLDAGIGLGMSEDKVDVTKFESIRDTYYPGSSLFMSFSITSREQANTFFKNELFKPLNMYPIVTGEGLYSATIYAPPLPPFSKTTITEDDTIGIPKYDGNLSKLINEIQYSYDVDIEGEFANIAVFAKAASINARGVGDKTLEIDSRGLHSDSTDVDGYMERATNRIFNRYANPPIKLDVKVTFDKLLIEGGDVVLVSNKFLPNLETGLFDFEDVPMEVLKRSVDWKNGSVNLSLLQTGFDNLNYAAISPAYTVLSGISTTQFTVESAKDWDVGFHGCMYQWDTATGEFRQLDTDVTVTDIDETTNTITTTAMSTTPAENWRFVFSDKATETNVQTAWSIIDGTYYIIP